MATKHKLTEDQEKFVAQVDDVCMPLTNWCREMLEAGCTVPQLKDKFWRLAEQAGRK